MQCIYALLQNKLKSRPTYAPGPILTVREKPPVLQSGAEQLQTAILWRAEKNRGMIATGASAHALKFPLYVQECCWNEYAAAHDYNALWKHALYSVTWLWELFTRKYCANDHTYLRNMGYDYICLDNTRTVFSRLTKLKDMRRYSYIMSS